MRRAEREAQWRQRIQAWRDSGLSGLKYCRREQINLKQFYQWRKRLTEDNWLPVSVPSDATSGTVRIDLGDDVHIIVDEQSSPIALRLALDTLT